MNRQKRKEQKAILRVSGRRWWVTFSESGPKSRERAKKKVRRAVFIAAIKSGFGFRRIKAYRKRQPERGEAQKAWRRYQAWKASLKHE